MDDNTLTVNVARLRSHLEEIGLGGLVRTQKGVGYLVEEQHEQRMQTGICLSV